MDSGARFYKCDFQVHTPRDPQWKGGGAVLDDERRQYAREFVAACRSKGLQAVAITDHHDLAFFKYIREAALAETDNEGTALAPHLRLVVFPGMELTLAVPCQAILLLDAEFPVDLLPQVVQALSVTPAPDASPHHAPVVRLEHIKTIEALYEELNKKEFLRGRFIVFPHVGESRSSSMLRKGMADRYKRMPSVGGYMDGSIAQLGTGNADIVAGVCKEWGNKAVALFQTSDNRSREFEQLGAHVTWVKWALPTAEALRQACLARQSRISQSEPSLPSIRVARIEVSNSKFLGPIALEFNPQYNAVIGGRGTGKSTILEYLRWALCDQPPSAVGGGAEDLPDFQRRRQSLIEGTLLPLQAVVDVSFLLNGVPHIVRRKAAGEISLKIADLPFRACTEQDVRDLLPIRAYSQKQLGAVGARLDELRRFVHGPIQTRLDEIEERIAGLRAELRSTFERVVRHREIQADMAARDIERQSLRKQAEGLRSALKGLSPEDQAIITRQATYEAEHRVVQGMERDANGARDALAAASVTIERLGKPAADDGRSLQNGELLGQARAALAHWIIGVRQTIASLHSALTDPAGEGHLAPYFASVAEWRVRRDAHRTEYDQAKARAAAHEETLRQIQALESRLAETNEAADVKAQELAELDDPARGFAALRGSWKAVHQDRADVVEQQCRELTAATGSRLRATLASGGGHGAARGAAATGREGYQDPRRTSRQTARSSRAVPESAGRMA
jgi:chromosome segregation protein